MDPNAALREIDDADRIDAETREAMRGLHGWLSRGGFAPDWQRYPKGSSRFRKMFGLQRGMTTPKTRGHATKTKGRSRAHATAREVISRNIGIGDIVQRSDIDSKNRYVVTDIHGPWIFTKRISGSGGPGVITFLPRALKKVG